MRKLTALLFVLMVLIFQFCSSSKKIAATPKLTYDANVKPVVVANCTPCHFPPGGNKEPLNSYTALTKNIDSVIARIQKNPADKGFMPFKHPKLPDSTIQVFVRWKNEGMLE